MRCTRSRWYLCPGDSSPGSQSPGCGYYYSSAALSSAAPPPRARPSRPHSGSAADRGRSRPRRAPAPGLRSAPPPRRRRGQPPALTAFATRIRASILGAHGAGNSHDDPTREKLRAEGGQRLEIVFECDRQRIVAGVGGDDRAATAGSGGRGLTGGRIGRRIPAAGADVDQPGVGRHTGTGRWRIVHAGPRVELDAVRVLLDGGEQPALFGAVLCV